jgi:MoxR-like ATPase
MTPERRPGSPDIIQSTGRERRPGASPKTFVIKLSFTALLSEGHLLLEDFPGTGTGLSRVPWRKV